MKVIIKWFLWITIMVSVLFVIIFLWLISPMKSPENDVLSDNCYYIAHATGAIKGDTYLNCKESLMQSLDKGYKYIEVDLGKTTDSDLVCVHDWAYFHKITNNETTNNFTNNPFSKSEFQKKLILGRYTPLTLEDVISIRNNHPFIIVTDKISDTKTLNRYFSKTRNQVMVEAFSITDYDELKEAGYIPMMSIWKFDYQTLLWYFIHYPLKYDKKIEWICVSTSSNMNSLRMLKRLFNCNVAMYKSNSPSFFSEHLGKEIDLIYTDDWNPKSHK
jgi:hypothetical protein